jgi:hypothetical protein
MGKGMDVCKEDPNENFSDQFSSHLDQRENFDNCEKFQDLKRSMLHLNYTEW